MIRDAVLSASGLLSEKIGGQSVFPQPDGIWDNPYSDAKWVISEGEDRYRRGSTPSSAGRRPIRAS